MTPSLGRGWTIAALGAALLATACSQGTTGSATGGATSGGPKTTLAARLRGEAEVPPTAVAGTGMATLSLDQTSKTLTWEISYASLTGEARAAHFHGPADAGANAGVAVPIPIGPSPLRGAAVLTDAQVADLLAGKYYINIHTGAHQAGEIRGQVVPR
jgi:hypothetical protein